LSFPLVGNPSDSSLSKGDKGGCFEERFWLGQNDNIKDLKSWLSFFFVIARLDRAIQGKELDYPVEPDNDNHWNRVRYE